MGRNLRKKVPQSGNDADLDLDHGRDSSVPERMSWLKRINGFLAKLTEVTFNGVLDVCAFLCIVPFSKCSPSGNSLNSGDGKAVELLGEVRGARDFEFELELKERAGVVSGGVGVD
jgi:hypothetical protein